MASVTPCRLWGARITCGDLQIHGDSGINQTPGIHEAPGIHGVQLPGIQELIQVEKTNSTDIKIKAL